MKQFSEIREASKSAIKWRVKPPAGTKNVHPDSKWPGMKPGDIEKMNESVELVEKSEAWVLVQNRKIIKKFKTKPSNSAFTSSDNQTLMTVSKAAKMGINESVELDEAQGKLNAKGEIEMTAKNYAKIHKDFKTKIKGTPFAMQIDPKTGGSALFPVTFIKESTDLTEGKNLIPQFQDIVKNKQAKKIGGTMIDMYTASTITHVYDKVSDANKKKMETSNINVLIGLSRKIMGAGQKESVEVVEGDEYKNISKTITQTPKHKRDKKATAAKPAKTNAREVARRKAIEKHQAKNAAKKEKGYWDESAKGMIAGFSVEIPKQTISGKTIGGGKGGMFVKAKTARQAISMAAKRLGVDFKMLKAEGVESFSESVNLEEGKMKEFHDYIDQGKSAQWIAKKMGLDMKTVKELMADMKESVEEGKTGAARLTNRLKKSGVDLDKRAKDRAASHAELKKKYAAESVELDEAYQQFLDKTPNWGEDKAISYGRKKGYKEIGVCGHGKIDGIVLFGLDAGDKSYVGKEAKVKTGQTVFRYATSRTVAGDIFPLVKIDVKKGLLYNLSQKSSEGEIEHAEFETKSSKLRYLRLLSTANLRDIVGFDAEIKESVDLDEAISVQDIKKLDGKTVSPLQWHAIRTSKDIKKISMLGKTGSKGSTKHGVIFKDTTSVDIFVESTAPKTLSDIRAER